MKILVSAMLVASTLLAPVATPVLAAAKVAISCPADAPESFKRAGGYCEQIESLKSIAPNGSGVGCQLKLADLADPATMRMQIASMDPCHYDDCSAINAGTLDLLPEGVLRKSDEVDLMVAC
jgi:hypothetical protein